MRRALAAGDRDIAPRRALVPARQSRQPQATRCRSSSITTASARWAKRRRSSAVDGLYSATVLVPQDASLRVRSAIELLREGNVVQARAILAPAAFRAEALGENPPLKLIREMEKTEDAAALLAKAEELKLGRQRVHREPGEEEDKEDGDDDEEDSEG